MTNNSEPLDIKEEMAKAGVVLATRIYLCDLIPPEIFPADIECTMEIWSTTGDYLEDGEVKDLPPILRNLHDESAYIRVSEKLFGEIAEELTRRDEDQIVVVLPQVLLIGNQGNVEFPYSIVSSSSPRVYDPAQLNLFGWENPEPPSNVVYPFTKWDSVLEY